MLSSHYRDKIQVTATNKGGLPPYFFNILKIFEYNIVYKNKKKTFTLHKKCVIILIVPRNGTDVK